MLLQALTYTFQATHVGVIERIDIGLAKPHHAPAGANGTPPPPLLPSGATCSLASVTVTDLVANTTFYFNTDVWLEPRWAA